MHWPEAIDWNHSITSSVVVHDLDFVSIAIAPNEAQAPLAIDTYAVLSRAISAQGFQTVAWWAAQKLKGYGGVKLRQFALRNALESGKVLRALAGEQLGGVLAAKRFDHASRVLR
jgi:hypothetical protein